MKTSHPDSKTLRHSSNLQVGPSPAPHHQHVTPTSTTETHDQQSPPSLNTEPNDKPTGLLHGKVAFFTHVNTLSTFEVLDTTLS